MRIPTNAPRSATLRHLAVSALVLMGHPNAQEPDTSWVDRERLLAGDVLVDFGDTPRFRGFIRAAVLVEAPPDRIWEILKDCESAPEYVPHVERCELVESRNDGLLQIYRQEVRYAWFLPRFEHVFSLRYRPHSRVDVQRVSGPIEHMSGVWRLTPAEEHHTELTYELELRPGLPVPRFVVGATLRQDIPTVLAEVRERAEAPPPRDHP